MRKVFLIFLFFQAILLASQSDLPEVYTVKIEDTGNDISFYLDQAVLEAIVRATGNFEETRNSKKIMDLDLNSYVREYKFLQEQNKNFIEIKIDAVELRSKLFDSLSSTKELYIILLCPNLLLKLIISGRNFE